MKEIDWSKAPDDATHANGAGVFLRESPGGFVMEFEKGLWCCTSSRLSDFNPDYLFRRPIFWPGKGLPLAGAVCEIKFAHWPDWLRHEILCVGKSCVFVRELDGGFDREGCMDLDGIMFRPIRTPEQIAAEERKAEIEAMAKILGVVACDDYVAAAALYDAGYRKQVAP